MPRGSILVVCALVAGCDGGLTSGFSLDCDRCLCSNLETQQTAVVSNRINCPGGWVRASINECTNSQTGKVELKLMNDSRECPEGYTGGLIHDLCHLDPDPNDPNNSDLCIFHN